MRIRQAFSMEPDYDQDERWANPGYSTHKSFIVLHQKGGTVKYSQLKWALEVIKRYRQNRVDFPDESEYIKANRKGRFLGDGLD